MIEFILALDPSGQFNEGKGTTGYAILGVADNTLVEVGIISANSAECMEGYWLQHVLLLQRVLHQYPNCAVRLEDYLLYAHKAKNQIQSHMETPQLLGVIKYWCFVNNVKLFVRTASTVKNRWTDELLEHKGYIKKNGNSWSACCRNHLTLHERDAIRHAVACYHFDLEKDDDERS